MDDMDGLDVEDIVNKKNTKKVNCKKKGNRTELELTKILSARFNKNFSRSVGSGNRWSQASLTEEATQVFSGDLVVPKGFKFVIESKGGYDDIDINSIFIKGNTNLENFMQQVVDDSQRCGRKPILCWKRNRKPWLAFLLTKDLVGHEFEYAVKYKEWTGVALENLLKLEDSFFYS